MNAGASGTAIGTPRDRWLEGAVGVLGWTIVLAIAATSTTPLTYDEPYYLAPVAAFQQYGLSVSLIVNYPEVAGLVHTGIHWALSPVTHLAVPAVRLVNPFIVAFAIAACAWLLAVARTPGSNAFPLRLLALPPIWVVSGLALTEPSAIALVAVSLGMFYRSRDRTSTGGAWALAAAAGLVLAGAVLAKQGTLAILGGVAWLGWTRPDWRPHATAYLLAALLILLPIFVAWGGFAPPVAAGKQVGLFSVKHVVLAFGYAAGFATILAHGFFAGRLRWALAHLAAGLLLNQVFGLIEMRLFASAATRILTGSLLALYDRLWGGILIGAAVFFAVTVIARFRDHREDPVWTSAAISLLLGLGSLGAVTYSFSSRYLTLVSPLMLIVLLPYRRSGSVSLLLLIVGHVAGAVSLLAYLGYLPR